MRIIIENKTLIIELSGGEKLCTCRRRLEIPVEHICDIKMGLPEPRLEMPMFATSIPGIMKAGTFWTKEGREFWFVKPDMRRYLTIELSPTAKFRRLVVGLSEGEDSFLGQLGIQIRMPAEVEN